MIEIIKIQTKGNCDLINITERIEPAKVKEATIKYRKENDIYRQFMEENIIENYSL